MKYWKEGDLFDYLKDNYYPDLVKSDNPLSRWDCYSAIHNHRIELKCRTKHYPDLMIEKKKYVAMLDHCKGTFEIPTYINSTPDGVYRFNLKKFRPRWQVRNLNKTTHFSQQHKISKQVGFLKITKADKL
tara:strand:- start:1258 stop:1647 length:390 start_codon:yes stop_codon:yes gene_type:complete